jgi:hypothetical protein
VKVVFATLFLTRPTDQFIAALEATVPLVEAAGWEHGLAQEVGNPYISAGRASLARKALDAKADVIVYLDYDVSWSPRDLLTLLETPGDVVAGVYRYKRDAEEYMGAVFSDERGQPLGRKDGCLSAHRVPAGFLKITKEAVGCFMQAYPHLVYGEPWRPAVDLFNHGAHEGLWYGEDYAFSRNWLAIGGEMWIVPDLDITHHAKDKDYPGNFHEFLLKQPKLEEQAEDDFAKYVAWRKKQGA